jgi:hypothetical protein
MEELKLFDIDDDEPVREHFPKLDKLLLVTLQDML